MLPSSSAAASTAAAVVVLWLPLTATVVRPACAHTSASACPRARTGT
ncbi:hypothetical protein [Kitasatospora sp. NPDC091207]